MKREFDAKKYFDKNGYIYGISEKYEFGWKGYCEKFDSYAKAEEWLNTEEYDFHERRLCTKTESLKSGYGLID